MSITHELRIDHRIGSVSIHPVMNVLRFRVETRVAGFIAEVRRRRTLRYLNRFADRRLHDIGFERDWDGSVIPTVKG